MLLPVALTPRAATFDGPEAVEIEYPKHLLYEWRVGPDKDGLLFSPVTFTGTRVLQDAVRTVTALVLDYDDGTTPEDAIGPWEPFDFVIYTTFSHRRVEPPKYNGEQRFRIVLPLASPLGPVPFRELWRWAAGRSAGRIDANCKDLFRRYYWPSHAADAPDVFALHNPGRLLAYADVYPGVTSPLIPPTPSGTLATKAGVLGALLGLPAPPPRAAPSGLFAGMDKARSDGLRQAESIEQIESKCAFMAHAAARAATLGEPEWYAALSVWARCEDGDNVAQERSAPHPGYDEHATADKLERAKAVGPATCARVSDMFAGCKTCPHFGRITSPVQLGAPDPVAEPDAAVEHARTDVDDARAAAAAARAAVERARDDYNAARKSAKFLPDADARAAEVETERRALEAAIEERDRAAARVKTAERNARVTEQIAAPPEGTEAAVWRALKLNPATSAPVPCYSNVYKIARLDPLLGPRLRTNMLGEVPEWGGSPVVDNDLSIMCEYLADGYSVEARLSDVKSAIAAVASRDRYNPVAEWLRALPAWDGAPRAGALLSDVLRVEDTPEGLYATYLQKFMIAAVRRALAPGTKVDTMLVLQGPQGLRKSQFFAVMFGAAFVHDTAFDIGNKDAYGQIAHGWLYEWAELSGLSRKEIDAVKNFISSARDTYRSPYAHFASVHPRHTVFGGTTNNPTPLNDPTGARRFWIIPLLERIALELLADMRDQLWAEALARAAAGELHYLTDDEDSCQRADALQFEEEDPRRVLVKRWLDKRREPFDTAEICIVLGVPPDRVSARMIGAHLRALGARSRTLNGGAIRQWCPPDYGEVAVNVVKFALSEPQTQVFSGKALRP